MILRDLCNMALQTLHYTRFPAGSGSAALETIVIGITMANKTTAGITASIFIDNENGSNDVFIVKDATIPRYLIRSHVGK